MNLINKEVVHKSFGKGKIVDFADTYFVVNFKSGRKSFIYPDAFARYLTLVDKKASEEINRVLKKHIIKQKEEEERVEQERILELEKRQRKLEVEKYLKNHRIHHSSQVAFNCQEEELDSIFSEWKVFVGAIKSGKNQGKPNKLVRTHQNSACIITLSIPGMEEKDRPIVGVYMVEETFVGRMREDGYIPAHSKYRIRLKEEEYKKLPFWKYYINNRYPNSMTWNSGRYRYFDNIWMAQVLRDIVSMKEDEERDLAKEYFEYFCLKNQINENEIPEAGGVLMQIK